MKTYQLLIFLSIVSVFSTNNGFTQTSLVSSGGDVNGSNGSVSFSIGQICYATVQGSNGLILEGVQQPFEIIDVSAIKEFPSEICSIVVFPNPTTKYVTISTQNTTQIENFCYQLLDANGRIIKTKAIQSENEQIDFSELLPSIYFLKIFQENREVKNFKIVKS